MLLIFAEGMYFVTFSQTQSSKSAGPCQQKFPPGISTELLSLKDNMSFFTFLLPNVVGGMVC